MTRVAMISAVSPYPTDAGKKVVLAGLIDYFLARLPARDVHYLLIGNQHEGRFPAQLTQIAGPSTRQAVSNLVTRTAMGRASIQESFLWSRRTRTALRDKLEQVGADIEVYDTVRTAQYAADDSGPTRICYLDDLFSERYASMLSAMRVDKSIEFRPLGNFARHVPTRLHSFTENSITQKALLRVETFLIARSENRTAQSFGRCLLVNPHETALLQKRAAVPAGRVDTLPPLLKAAQRVNRDYRGAPLFLFLGLLSLPHNDDGLRTFIRHVWPRVLRRLPDAKLRVVGRDPQPELLTAISEFGGGAVSLEGFVPDLRALMAESAAMVNPLRFGSGIKLKVIESLAQGLPVVSSDTGASGVLGGAENGVCLAKAPDEWVDHLEALTAPGHNSETSAAAAAHFARVYSRTAVFARYDAIFGLG